MTAPNTQPIFTVVPEIQFVTGSFTGTIWAASDITGATIGTSVHLVFTAGAQGSYVQRLRFRMIPQTSAVSTTATKVRVWLNNGSTIATAANSVMYDEIGLPLTTEALAAQTIGYDLPMNFALPAGWKIYLTVATASANGWAASCIAGDY